MTVKALIKELVKREGLKKKVDIAQVSEIVGHLSDLILGELTSGEPHSKILENLIKNGNKRFKENLKKASKR